MSEEDDIELHEKELDLHEKRFELLEARVEVLENYKKAREAEEHQVNAAKHSSLSLWFSGAVVLLFVVELILLLPQVQAWIAHSH